MRNSRERGRGMPSTCGCNAPRITMPPRCTCCGAYSNPLDEPRFLVAPTLGWLAEFLARREARRNPAPQLEGRIRACADVHGRLWTATKRRSDPSHIIESFYPPGPRQPNDQLIRALLAAAYSTGMIAHGLPGPPNLAN